MCYSAMVVQDLKSIGRQLRAEPDLCAFENLFHARVADGSIKIPKAMEANFADPGLPAETRIKLDIDRHHQRLTAEYESALFAQRKRFADAERALAIKQTKKAIDEMRISGNKIAWFQDKLAALNSRTLKPDDSRIFPMVYAPVVVMEKGQYLIKPMRYHCRPNGKPDWYDRKFDGLYNARRDSLGKFWKGVFGRRHGVLVASSFFENVARHDFEKRELRAGEKPGNVILHFNPRESAPMLVACLWDHWQEAGKPDLLSFAAITDEPPEEVAATGHDRCIVPLKPEHVRQWLDPESTDLKVLDSLLEDRQRPYYVHRLAA